MLTLYDCSTAPSPRRTRIFLAEKGIKYECLQIDLAKGEQMKDEFAAINPRRTVPVLITEDGKSLSENLAIAYYVDQLHPEPPLMGTDRFSRANVLEWNARVEFEGLHAIAEILRNTSPHMKNRAMTGRQNIPQIQELAERGRMRIETFWEDLDNRLQETPFVAGDNFTLADITALVCVDFARWVKASPAENLKALHSWHNKVSKRPSAHA